MLSQMHYISPVIISLDLVLSCHNIELVYISLHYIASYTVFSVFRKYSHPFAHFYCVVDLILTG